MQKLKWVKRGTVVGAIYFLMHTLGNVSLQKQHLEKRCDIYKQATAKLAEMAGPEVVSEWTAEMEKDLEFYKIVSNLTVTDVDR